MIPSSTVSVQPGDIDLAIHVWTAPGSPSGIVLIVHGYAEHGGRYGSLAEAFVAAGFTAVAYDQRGYGRSGGRSAYVDRFQRYVDDFGTVLSWSAERWPDLPCYVFGHSMGGAVCATYCLEHPSCCVDGLILSSPMLGTFEAPLLQRLSGVLGALMPLLPTIPLRRELISRDAAVVAEAENDPLNYHGGVRARTGAEMVRAMNHLEAHGHKLALPLLVIHGSADRLTDPERSADLYARAASTDKQLGLYDGLLHETFNEPERAMVIEEITEWLEEHVEGVT